MKTLRYAYHDTPPRNVALDEELPDEVIPLVLRAALAGKESTPDALAALEELTIESATLRSLDALPLLPGLRSLTLRTPALEDLGGLVRAAQLRELYLHGAAATDLRPLAALRKLSLLSLDRVSVSDLAPLARLTALRELRIERSRVSDLTPLVGLVKLREFSLCNNPIEELGPLASLHEVRRLFLHYTRVRTIAPLRGLRSLAVLGLAGCPIEDLSAVVELPALQAVLLAYTRVDRAHVEVLRQERPEVDFDGLDREPPAPAKEAADSVPVQPETPAILEAVAAAAELTLQTYEAPPVIRGLALRGAPRPALPFASNPWGIPADAAGAEVITRVWEPLRRRAPRFVQTLEREALGVALLAGPDEQTLALGYLFPWFSGESTEDRAASSSIAELIERNELSVVIGTVPGAAPRAPELAEFVAPLALRELQAVHGTLLGPGARVGELDTFSFLTDEDAVAQFEERNGAPPDRFVTFASRELDRVVFDLDQLDGRGDPLVREWFREGWQLAPRATSFWEWFQLEPFVLPRR